MSFIKVYLPIVWSTKNREPLLDTREIRFTVWKHIYDNAHEKSIFVDTVNGHSDHCHCLVSLRSDQSIKDIVQSIKGESSYWINKHNLVEGKFEWQSEYFAVSVSESMVEKVRFYIRNQEEHHKTKSFDVECNEFFRNYGFENLRRDN